MATIQTREETVEFPDNSPIREACEELEVPFGCRSGLCGACMITITKGEENLSTLTDEENDMQRDRTHRLACQAKIKSGSVTIELE